MKIEYLQEGPYAEFALAGNVLQIVGLNIDIGARQADGQVIIDITRQNGAIVEGVGRQGAYVANVLLPPKEYEEVATGEMDENGRPRIERRALPLNTNQALLKLWQLKPENSNQGGTI